MQTHLLKRAAPSRAGLVVPNSAEIGFAMVKARGGNRSRWRADRLLMEAVTQEVMARRVDRPAFDHFMVILEGMLGVLKETLASDGFPGQAIRACRPSARSAGFPLGAASPSRSA